MMTSRRWCVSIIALALVFICACTAAPSPTVPSSAPQLGSLTLTAGPGPKTASVAAPSRDSTPTKRASVTALPSARCTTTHILGTWSTERLAEQTVVVPVDENNIGTIMPEISDGAGGVILFGDSAPSDMGAQLQALKSHALGGLAPFVMTDEEGGAVQRMANVVGQIPSARQMAASPGTIKSIAYGLAQRMRQYGITMDLAPVLDLDNGVGPNNVDADGTRSFGLDATATTSDGLAFSAGLIQGGIIPVVKHFPGLGQTAGNTDLGAAKTLPWGTLQGAGLLPFAAAIQAGVPAIMVTNASVPGLTSLPASISPAVNTGVLRNQLKFTGLIMTDSLSSGSLSSAGYSVPLAAAAAINAGADMILFSALPAQIAALTASTVSTIATSVPRSTLIRAAGHILADKNIVLC